MYILTYVQVIEAWIKRSSGSYRKNKMIANVTRYATRTYRIRRIRRIYPHHRIARIYTLDSGLWTLDSGQTPTSKRERTTDTGLAETTEQKLSVPIMLMYQRPRRWSCMSRCTVRPSNSRLKAIVCVHSDLTLQSVADTPDFFPSRQGYRAIPQGRKQSRAIFHPTY